MFLRAFPHFPAGAIMLATGCGDGSSLAKGPPPELDLHTSCVAHASWTKTGDNGCSTCTAHATVPACTCTSNEPYNGVCNQAIVDRANDPDCTTSLNDCVASCSPTACGCVEACYSGHDSCNAATAHVLSCLLDACGSVCN